MLTLPDLKVGENEMLTLPVSGEAAYPDLKVGENEMLTLPDLKVGENEMLTLPDPKGRGEWDVDAAGSCRFVLIRGSCLRASATK